MRVYVDKKKAVAIILIVLAFVAPMAWWTLQSLDMKNEFVAEMRAGRVTQFPPHLQDKEWTDRDLATAKVTKLIPFHGRGHIIEALYHFGEFTLPATQYSFQASAVDTSTGMKYMFGRSKHEPARWVWAGIHPDSHEQWIALRGREVEALEGQYYDEKKINAMRRSPPPVP